MRLYEKENLKGGLADGKSLEDIAKHHNVPLKDIQKEFEMGMKVEMEHTEDEQIASEIAKDHILEIKNYYSRLKKIESGVE